MTVAEFIAKWKRSDLKERSAAQEHFIDLCRLVGHPTPAEVDPTGATFCFEKGAAKHGGGDGFADVWKKDFFGKEYKGKHKDLEAAYDQLLLYRDALESPPLLVVCDFERIVIHTNFTKTAFAGFASVTSPWASKCQRWRSTISGSSKIGRQGPFSVSPR